MPKYASLVDVERDFQNVQDLASLWGELRTELDDYDVELEHSYAILGEYDFLIVMDVPDREAAYQASVSMIGHGLDVQTMEVIPTEEFATLVDDR